MVAAAVFIAPSKPFTIREFSKDIVSNLEPKGRKEGLLADG